MLSGVAGWAVCIGVVVAVGLVLYLRRGPVASLGPAMVVSFLFPVWLEEKIGGIPFSVQTSVAVITMLAYVCHPNGRILSPLTLLDFGIALLFCSHLLTEVMIDGVYLALPFRAYGEWVLPYVAGRFAVRDTNDLKAISPWVMGVLVLLAIASCVESVARVNVFELLFGDRPVELSNRNAARLGFKRAFGPAMHAIFFGMLMVVLTPWLCCQYQNLESRISRKWTVCAFAVAFLGILSTVSRTPVLTVIGAAMILLATLVKPVRWPVAATGILAVLAFVVFPGQVVDVVSEYTGGGHQKRLMAVDGEAEVYSSSRSRLLVVKKYSDTMMKAGFTGYGTRATSKFPPDIPHLLGKEENRQSMKMVDNAYVLFTLRFGWLGCGALILLLCTSVFCCWTLYAERPDQWFAAAMGAMLFVYTTFSLNLVWQSYDFGLPVLSTLGVVSGLCSYRSAMRSQRWRATW